MESSNLYIRSIPSTITNEAEAITFLVKIFKEYGTIRSTAAKFNTKYNAFNCFVSFEDVASAKKALEALNNKDIEGSVLYVSYNLNRNGPGGA